MKIALVILGIACTSVLILNKDSVVGSGTIVTQPLEISEFSTIEIRMPVDVKVSFGKKQTVNVKGDDNLLPLIKTEIKKGCLIISSDVTFKTKKRIEYTIVVPELNAAAIVGAGDIHIDKLKNKVMNISIHGSGDVHANGYTDSLSVSITGSGDALLKELTCERATVAIVGSGDIRIGDSKTLTISINGSGDVSYFGNPTVTQNIIGSGDVHKRS